MTAEAAMTKDEQDRLMKEFAKLTIDEAPFITVYFSASIGAYQPGVHCDFYAYHKNVWRSEDAWVEQ